MGITSNHLSKVRCLCQITNTDDFLTRRDISVHIPTRGRGGMRDHYSQGGIFHCSEGLTTSFPGYFPSERPWLVWSRGTRILSASKENKCGRCARDRFLFLFNLSLARKISCFLKTNAHIRSFYLLPPRFWVPRDQTQPGPFFRERKKPGNEVAGLLEVFKISIIQQVLRTRGMRCKD